MSTVNVTIDVKLLASLVDCLLAQKQFNPMETDLHKQLESATNNVLSAAEQILQQHMGPQSFSTGTFGQHGVDGSKSSFL